MSARSPLRVWSLELHPLRIGPFVKPRGDLESGQWGLIPQKSETNIPRTREGKRMSTNNARDDRIATAWTYRFPWAKGQRCLIPASNFTEPYWGLHEKHIPWRFKRADGHPWALAGIWSEWVDPATGEVLPNFSLITQNVDAHLLLKLMHKPDKKLSAENQDKRGVVPVEREDWDAWLHGTIDQARGLIKLPSVEVFEHGPEDSTVKVALDLATGEPIVERDPTSLF